MKKLSPSLSRREKLLLGLLTSTLIFSASFSYGAVNSNKVDSIMKMITDGGAKFSDIPVSGQTKSERTQYFEKVDAGLGDAVEMLAIVRNNIRSLMGLSPAYTADDIVGSILGGLVSGVGGNTGTTTSPANPGQTAQQVLGIFANTPIPAPCPANTIVMKEDLGKVGAGAWLHRSWNNKNPALGTYHVYKLTLKETAATYKEMLKTMPSPRVAFDSAGRTSGVGTQDTHIKISPYPCDFVNQADLDNAKAQGYGWDGGFGACGNKDIDVTYKIDGVDDPKNTGSCTLKLGGTYYVNVGPPPTTSMVTESGYDKYTIMNRTSYNDPAGLYGIYPFVKDADGISTNPQYDAWKDKNNSSNENAEALRQTVVNSYKSQIGSQTSGNTGGGVFIYRVKSISSQETANKARNEAQALQCISSVDELRRINPDTIGPNNPNGYEYSTYKGLGKDCYFNVKDHAHVIAWSKNPEVKNRPANIPDSCRVGTKFVANAERGIVLAECVTREYAYGIGKSSPNCTDDPKVVVFDLNKMRGNSTFTEEASYAKGDKAGIEFTKNSGETETSEVISIRIDLRDGKFDPDILPKKITNVPNYYQNDEYPTWGASWYTNDKMWQRYDQVSTELASLSQCAGDFTSSEVRLIGGYRSDTPISSFSQLVMGQLDHPSRKLQLLEGSEKIVNGTKNIFLQPGSVWYLNYRVQYGMNRSSPYTIPLKADGTPYPSNKTTWPFGSAPISSQFGYKQPCSLQNDGSIKEGCLDIIDRNTFKSFFSNVPDNAQLYWSTIAL